MTAPTAGGRGVNLCAPHSVDRCPVKIWCPRNWGKKTHRGFRQGSASELLPELALDDFVGAKVKDSRAWPATPLALSNRLRRAASGLHELGIYVKIGTRANTRDRKRPITIRYQGDA